MKLQVSGVPAGQYTGEFIGVEPREAQGDFGPSLVWQFVIVGGQFDGQVVTRFTGDSATVRNACGRITRAITGQPLVPGTEIDLGKYVGRRFAVIVADAPSGNGTRVESCVPTAEEAA